MAEYKGLDEKTLVLIKPDGVKRGLVGEIIGRFERAGLKLVGMKLMQPERKFAAGHYPNPDDQKRIRGQRTLDNYKKAGLDPKTELGTDNVMKIGELVIEWTVDTMISGPVVAMVLQGNHSVEVVRKLVGGTIPSEALPGTIRGDFSKDSPALANAQKRAVKNVVHASGTIEEAHVEVPYWFSEEELVDYKRSDEDVAFA